VAVPFAEQGELLSRIAAQALALYPQDHIFHFRLAAGQYLCGDFDGALDNIDTALRLLPANAWRTSHSLLQQQYLTRREAILNGSAEARHAETQRERWEQQDRANAALVGTLQKSTVRSVELVAIFTAAIAFAVGSLNVTLNGNLTLGARLWMLAGLGGGLSIFALTIVGGTWLITRGSK